MRAWGYQGRYREDSESDWQSESEVTDSLTPLEVDVFHALMNVDIHCLADPRRQRVRKQRDPRFHRNVFSLFPIGTLIVNPSKAESCEDKSTTTSVDVGVFGMRTMIGRSCLGRRWRSS